MFKKILKWLGICAGVAVVGLLVAMCVSWFAIDWEGEEASREYAGGVVLRDAAGNVLRVSLGPGDVDCRPYYEADENDWIVKALVAVEDGEFWNHCGIRPLSMLRAFFQNVFYRRRISGASTISMQAVRLIKPHKKSYAAKWVEAFEALKMERRKSKKWILSQYLNRAPYGSNFIGIEAAANGWFGKSAKSLGISEAAMLAAMVQAPSRFRPDRGYERAVKRRDYVLERMQKMGYITEEQKEGAKGVCNVVCRSPRPFLAPYFCDYVLKELGRDREAQRKSGDIRTALDADIQAVCEAAVNDAATSGGYSVAAVVVDVATAQVVALACSGDYFDSDSGQVNTALAPRPAGSTLKPFLFALALDAGALTPEERLKDLPRSYKGYNPANFDSSYRGYVSASDALVLSLNIPFVQMVERVGLGRFGATLRALGFSHMDEPDERFGLGMAIGNVEITLVELTKAYAKIARGGDGVFSREAAYLVSDILSGRERSSASLGHVADVRAPRFAWKTGTSSAYRDAWTCAWNPQYSIGVWCGHKRGGFGDKTLVGAKAASPVAWRIARSLYPQNTGPWFVEPGGIVRRKACALTGLAANPDCPETIETRTIRGVPPPKVCGVHRRGYDGRSLEVLPPDIAAFEKREGGANALAILRPSQGAKFSRVEGVANQKISFAPYGNQAASPLWWFVDGIPAARTSGDEPFVWPLGEPGSHAVVCCDANGNSAEVQIEVE